MESPSRPPTDRSPMRLDAPSTAEPPIGDDRSSETEGVHRSADRTERHRASHDGKPWFRKRSWLIAGALILAAVILTVSLWLWYRSGFASTDDAFISARIVDVSPRVSGQVIAVPVNDNQLVRAGQPLVTIDPTGYRIALQQALGEEQQAETSLAAARANVAVTRAALRQAIAQLASARAQWVNAEQNLKRYLSVNPRAVARTQIDQEVAAARSATAERNAALQHVASAKSQILAAQAAVAEAVARIATARAQVHEARLRLSYTRVRASVAGHVTDRSVAVGTYVTPGEQMLALVPLHLWVTANFKETELALIHPGQPVTIHIDACPRADAHGHVNSIARGTGDAFALLPPENATGNYIKVVQRVPIKIVLDTIPRGCVLGPGMSVEPTIRVR